MLRKHRRSLLTAFAIVGSSLLSAPTHSAEAASSSCPTEFGAETPEGWKTCVFEFDCGEGAPDHACYRCGNNYYQFDCGTHPPTLGGYCDGVNGTCLMT